MRSTEAEMKAGNAGYDVRRGFGYWRVDFLMDTSAKVWLLEVEVVPSTGTIGGVDEEVSKEPRSLRSS